MFYVCSAQSIDSNCDASGKLWAGVSQTNGMASQLLEYWISDKANTQQSVRKNTLFIYIYIHIYIHMITHGKCQCQSSCNYSSMGPANAAKFTEAKSYFFSALCLAARQVGLPHARPHQGVTLIPRNLLAETQNHLSSSSARRHI